MDNPTSATANPLIDAILAAVQRVGYDPRVGNFGSMTYNTGRDNPLTIPINSPGLPGLVLKGDKPLTAEDAAHEGVHTNLGFEGSVLGTLAGKALGTGATAGYTQPDEALAYLTQPASPSTGTDMRTLQDLAKSKPSNPYMWLVQKAAAAKGAQ